MAADANTATDEKPSAGATVTGGRTANELRDVADALRNRVDLFGKALATVATLGTTAIGLNKIGDLFPTAGHDVWAWAACIALGIARLPFYKSRPSRPLLTTTLACGAFGVALPYIPPLAHLFGFKPLPLTFLAILVLMIATYLALAQIGVGLFFKPQGGRPLARAISAAERRITRGASRWGSWRHRTTPPKPPPTDNGNSVPVPTA